MLEFEDVLRKYDLANENEISLIEGRTDNCHVKVKEIRTRFLEKLYTYNDRITNEIKEKQDKEIELLSDLICEIDKEFIHKIYSNEKDKVLNIFHGVMKNQFYVLESEEKILEAKNQINKLKEARAKYENTVVNKVKKELKTYKLSNDEIEYITYMLKNIEV